jgi:hypothetical protein
MLREHHIPEHIFILFLKRRLSLANTVRLPIGSGQSTQKELTVGYNQAGNGNKPYEEIVEIFRLQLAESCTA